MICIYCSGGGAFSQEQNVINLHQEPILRLSYSHSCVFYHFATQVSSWALHYDPTPWSNTHILNNNFIDKSRVTLITFFIRFCSSLQDWCLNNHM